MSDFTNQIVSILQKRPNRSADAYYIGGSIAGEKWVKNPGCRSGYVTQVTKAGWNDSRIGVLPAKDRWGVATLFLHRQPG